MYPSCDGEFQHSTKSLFLRATQHRIGFFMSMFARLRRMNETARSGNCGDTSGRMKTWGCNSTAARRWKDRYFAAGIREYWIADGRREPTRFEIFRRCESGFETVTSNDGWVRSEVLNRSFQLVREADEFGNPTFRLDVS